MSLEIAKACLPHGWIVKPSAKYPDRIYYFNLVTGCSTWECPELVPKSLSDDFKEPALKKNNLFRGSDTESESTGRLSVSIHTPEESPGSTKSSHVYNNKRKSLKRPFEAVLVSPREDIFKVLRPPTAIVNPVILEQEKKSSTMTSSQDSKQQRNKVKSKPKHKNKFIPRSVVNKSPVKKSNQNSLKEPQHKNNQTKEKSPKNKSFTGQNRPSTSTATTYDTESTDSDMALEFGPSGLTPKPCPSGPYDSNEDNSCDDVEMIDVSANLTTVEEVVATAKESNQLLSYYIVTDTNVFVHELNHIDELKDTPLQGCGPPHIFIPWVVVKELDGLKTSTKNAGKLAGSAVRYLHKILKLKHPRFHGQSAKEAEDCKKTYHDSNDDRIIDCCLSLQAKMPPEKVILMTNDKNLANKAMIYKIVVHDWSSLLKEIKPDISIQASPAKKRRLKRKESDPAKMTCNAQKVLENKLKDERNAYKIEIDNVMYKARKLLKDVLDPLLVDEMRKTFGDKWLNFNIDQRLLRELLAAYLKFWPTVFRLVFIDKAKHNFELLHKKLVCPGPEGLYGTLEECQEILYTIKDIFGAVRSPQFSVSSSLRDIQILMDTCTHIFSKCYNVDSSLSAIESIIKETKEKSVIEVFNHDWTVINELCGMVMDFYGIQHTFVYNRPESIPPEKEYRRLVADLYPVLLQLRQLMKKMLNHILDSTPNKAVFRKLFTALKELVPSLDVKFIMPDMTDFTSGALERFCRDPQNRQRVEFGCKQLDNFCEKLKEAIQVMVSCNNSLSTSTAKI